MHRSNTAQVQSLEQPALSQRAFEETLPPTLLASHECGIPKTMVTAGQPWIEPAPLF